MWQALKNNELKKRNHLNINRVRLRTKRNTRQTEAQNTLHVAAAVCGTSSLARFSLLVWYLATLSAVSVLRSSTTPHAGEDVSGNTNKLSRIVIHPRHMTPFISPKGRKQET